MTSRDIIIKQAQEAYDNLLPLKEWANSYNLCVHILSKITEPKGERLRMIRGTHEGHWHYWLGLEDGTIIDPAPNGFYVGEDGDYRMDLVYGSVVL